jgi:DNA-binding response OmpR family regulator
MTANVFVVDDNPAVGRLSRLIIQSEGLEVESFTSSRNALEKLADDSYPNLAAIVLDLNMPDLNGRDFYRRAREVGYTYPVLILSLYGARSAQRKLGGGSAGEAVSA